MATSESLEKRASDKTPELSAELFDRLPPHNLDAERGVIASLLLNADLCDDVALVVRAEDFYADAHQRLFSQLIAMHDEGHRIDHTLLIERLKAKDELETIGGVPFLGELFESAPVAAHAEYYARIVRQKSTLRSLIHTSTEILHKAFEAGLDPQDVLSEAEEKVFAIAEQHGTGELSSMHDVLLEALDRIDARLDDDGASSGVETGFFELDHYTGGFQNGELIILAARPSMGKTSLAMNIAENATMKSQVPTLFVSLEMSRLELGERMLCSHAKINSHKLKSGMISDSNRRKLVETSSQLSQASLFVDDTPSRKVQEIASTARRLRRRNNLQLIIIDYLQLITPDTFKNDSRQEQVARMTRRLKALARELNVPVLCLAQLNRQAEMSKDNRPRLSHLRESGAIEQDADVVIFVHRDTQPTGESEQAPEADGTLSADEAEIIIAKQRNGPVGRFRLHWFAEYTRFENATSRDYNEFEDPF